MAILVLTTKPARVRRLAVEIPEEVVFDSNITRVQNRAELWSLVLIDEEVSDESLLLVERSVTAGQRTVLVLREPSLSKAVEAARAGALDVMSLPLDVERLRRLLGNTDAQPLNWQSAAQPGAVSQWIGNSPALLEAFRAAARAATTDAHVLILGEIGTGKELLARIIHEQSTRTGAFVAVNCGVLDETTLAAELYGTEAIGTAPAMTGQLSRAAGGTLFLDDLALLSPVLQARLARALHEGRYTAVGSFEDRALETRIIAASDRDLRRATGSFRSELLYEFASEIVLPPLRRRSEDISVLAAYFLEQFARAHQLNVRGFSSAAVEMLEKFDWPGNVRQLRNVVERAALACRGPVVQPSDLGPELTGSYEQLQDTDPGSVALEAVERRHIRQIWRITGGHLSETAELLGIHRNTLRRKMEQYGITEDDARV